MVAIGGTVVAVGIIAIVIVNSNNNARIQAELASRGNWQSPNTGAPTLSNDAGLLYAGLSGGAQLLGSIFTGIANINHSSQPAKNAAKNPAGETPSWVNQARSEHFGLAPQ